MLFARVCNIMKPCISVSQAHSPFYLFLFGIISCVHVSQLVLKNNMHRTKAHYYYHLLICRKPHFAPHTEIKLRARKYIGCWKTVIGAP